MKGRLNGWIPWKILEGMAPWPIPRWSLEPWSFHGCQRAAVAANSHPLPVHHWRSPGRRCQGAGWAFLGFPISSISFPAWTFSLAVNHSNDFPGFLVHWVKAKIIAPYKALQPCIPRFSLCKLPLSSPIDLVLDQHQWGCGPLPRGFAAVQDIPKSGWTKQFGMSSLIYRFIPFPRESAPL